MRGRTFAQMLRQHPLFAGLLTLQSLFVLLLLADLLYPAAMQEVTLTAADLTQTPHSSVPCRCRAVHMK